MRAIWKSGWLRGTWLGVCCLALAAGTGCQLNLDGPPPPVPFYPREMLELIPQKQPPEYTLSDDAAALKAAPGEPAAKAK